MYNRNPFAPFLVPYFLRIAGCYLDRRANRRRIHLPANLQSFFSRRLSLQAEISYRTDTV